MWKELIDSKEALIFDLDGTLIDSMGVWGKVDIDYFASLNMECPDDYQESIEGLSVYETAVYTKERFRLEDSIEDIIDSWNEMAFEEYSKNVPLKEYVCDLLEICKNKGIKLGIATSNSRQLTEEVLSKRGIIKYFDVILTGDECLIGKPAPDVYLKVADMLEVNYNKCLVFEDLCRGLEAGLRAGMETVAVWDEYSKCSWEDKREMSNYYLKDYKEIIDEICR